MRMIGGSNNSEARSDARRRMHPAPRHPVMDLAAPLPPLRRSGRESPGEFNAGAPASDVGGPGIRRRRPSRPSRRAWRLTHDA